jgi:hypothetical protein
LISLIVFYFILQTLLSTNMIIPLPTILIDRIVQDSSGTSKLPQLQFCASCRVTFEVGSIRAKVHYPMWPNCDSMYNSSSGDFTIIPGEPLRVFAVHWNCFRDHPVDYEHQNLDDPKCFTTIVPISKPCILMMLSQIRFDFTVTSEQRTVIMQRARDITSASMANTMSEIGRFLTQRPQPDVKIVYVDENQHALNYWSC